MLDLYQNYKMFKSIEIEYQKDNGETECIYCKINNLSSDRMIISANGVGKTIADGTTVSLSIYTDFGTYNAKSTVISSKDDDEHNTTVYEITYPKDNKHEQRREFYRADLEIPFTLTIERKERKTEIENVSKNICGKGICYQTTKPFLPYDKLTFEIRFEERTILAEAELVYTRNDMEQNPPKFIHAFSLTKIEDEDVRFIVSKCFLFLLQNESKN